MAEIVQSLFGVTPQMYQQQQSDAADDRAMQFARLSPFEQANFAIGRGASQLVGALGAQDPQLQMITARNQIARDLNPNDPASFQRARVQLQQINDIQGLQQLTQLEDQALTRQDQALTRQDAATKRRLGMESATRTAQAQALLPTAIRPAQAALEGQLPFDDEGNVMPGSVATPARFDIASIAPVLRMTPEGRALLKEQQGIDAAMAPKTVNVKEGESILRENPDGSFTPVVTGRTKLAPAIQEAIDFKNLTPQDQEVFKSLQVLKRPPAAVTEVKITNLEKTGQAELGKLVPDLYSQANSASSQLGQLPRYKAALDSAVTGAFANQRLTGLRIANALGFTGDKALNASREVIQGLSEMALNSRGLLAGQGQITEGEQKLLIQARSGDINFTKGELQTIFDVADRAARAQYAKSTNLLRSAAGQSPTAQMFLDNVSPLPSAPPLLRQPGASQIPTGAAAPAMPSGFRRVN